MNFKKNLISILVSGALVTGCAAQKAQKRAIDQNLVTEAHAYDYDETGSDLAAQLYLFEHSEPFTSLNQLEVYRYVGRDVNANHILDYRLEVTLTYYNHAVVGMSNKLVFRAEASTSGNDEVSEVLVRKTRNGNYRVRSTDFEGNVATKEITEEEAVGVFQEAMLTYRDGTFSRNLQHTNRLWDQLPQNVSVPGRVTVPLE